MADNRTWRQTPQGEWQYQGDDGNWYLGERPGATATAPPPVQAPPVVPDSTPPAVASPSSKSSTSSRRRWIWAGVATVVLAAVVVGIVFLVNSTGTHGLPPGTSLGAFQSRIVREAQGSFETPSAHSASCIMPSNWAAGRTFKCFVYNSAGKEVGEVDGTVTPTSPGDAWNSNDTWLPAG